MKLKIILITSAIFALCFVGCGIPTQSVDIALNTANLHINEAQKADAEQLASSEFDESKALLQNALSAQDNGQKIILAEQASVKARLAEALAKQAKAEQEAEKLEKELQIIEGKSASVRLERQIIEEELRQFIQGQKDNDNNK